VVFNELASRWSHRPSHLSALVTGAAGPAPYRLARRRSGRRRGIGANDKVLKQMPFADLAA
jgi:hypothetical protein